MDRPVPEFAFSLFCNLGVPIAIGPSHAGELRVHPVVDGVVDGPGIKGTVLPGGADWQTMRSDGILVLEAKYAIKTDDDVIVQVYNRGLAWIPAGTPSALPAPPTRSSAQFLAPTGRYDWMNKYVFVSAVKVPDGPIDRVWIDFFKMV